MFLERLFNKLIFNRWVVFHPSKQSMLVNPQTMLKQPVILAEFPNPSQHQTESTKTFSHLTFGEPLSTGSVLEEGFAHASHQGLPTNPILIFELNHMKQAKRPISGTTTTKQNHPQHWCHAQRKCVCVCVYSEKNCSV